jgi:hypothetical protein
MQVEPPVASSRMVESVTTFDSKGISRQQVVAVIIREEVYSDCPTNCRVNQLILMKCLECTKFIHI